MSPTNPYLLRPTGEKLALVTRNGRPYVKAEVLEEKKALQPGIPRKKEIREASSEPPEKARLPPIHEIKAVNTARKKEEPRRVAGLMASSSEGAPRLTSTRRAPLKKLTHHEVHEAPSVPIGICPMTGRWADRDDGSAVKTRLTAVGDEQELKSDAGSYEDQEQALKAWYEGLGEPARAGLEQAAAEMPPAAKLAPFEPLLTVPVLRALERDDMQPRAIQANGMKIPATPASAEVAEQERTHLPERPGCQHRIRGRGRDRAHSKADPEDRVVPVIELGYRDLTGRPPGKTEDDPFVEEKSSQICVVAVCRSTGYLFTSVVTEKGPGCGYAVAAMSSWLHELGHRRCILQSDGEPALIAFADAVRAKFVTSAETGAVKHASCRVSPVGSYASNDESLNKAYVAHTQNDDGLNKIDVEAVREGIDESLHKAYVAHTHNDDGHHKIDVESMRTRIDESPYEAPVAHKKNDDNVNEIDVAPMRTDDGLEEAPVEPLHTDSDAVFKKTHAKKYKYTGFHKAVHVYTGFQKTEEVHADFQKTNTKEKKYSDLEKPGAVSYVCAGSQKADIKKNKYLGFEKAGVYADIVYADFQEADIKEKKYLGFEKAHVVVYAGLQKADTVKKKYTGFEKADTEKERGAGLQKASAVKEKNIVGFKKVNAETEKNTAGYQKANEKNKESVGFEKAQVKKPQVQRDGNQVTGFKFTGCTRRGRLRRIGYADRDNPEAADRRSSSSGGILAWLAKCCLLALLLAGCSVLSYARGQASCAQSSCNAERYVLGSCAAESHQLASMLAEQGWAVEPPLRYSDSSSALTLVGRKGKPPEKTEDDPFAEEKSSETCVIAVYRSTGYLFASVATLDNLSDLLKKHVIRAEDKPLCRRHDPG